MWRDASGDFRNAQFCCDDLDAQADRACTSVPPELVGLHRVASGRASASRKTLPTSIDRPLRATERSF